MNIFSPICTSYHVIMLPQLYDWNFGPITRFKVFVCLSTLSGKESLDLNSLEL